MTDFTRVMSSAPVDSTAAKVMSKGVEYTPDVQLRNDSPVPIPTRPLPENMRPGEDLTGIVFGRFTVLGMALGVLGTWVVRCTCGIYTLRRRRAISNPNNNQDRCEACRHLASMKRSEVWRRTGKNINER